MIDSAVADDPMEKSLNGEELLECLANLWKHRIARGPLWQRGLNFLQSALADMDFEILSVGQCESIVRCVEIIQSSMLDKDDVQQIKRELRQCKLDPWKAISAGDNE